MAYQTILVQGNDFGTEILFAVCAEFVCFRPGFSFLAPFRPGRLAAGHADQVPRISQLSCFYQNHANFYNIPGHFKIADFHEKTHRFNYDEIGFSERGQNLTPVFLVPEHVFELEITPQIEVPIDKIRLPYYCAVSISL
jgi:hypothetical protein